VATGNLAVLIRAEAGVESMTVDISD